jgi:hypothetical protein
MKRYEACVEWRFVIVYEVGVHTKLMIRVYKCRFLESLSKIRLNVTCSDSGSNYIIYFSGSKDEATTNNRRWEGHQITFKYNNKTVRIKNSHGVNEMLVLLPYILLPEKSYAPKGLFEVEITSSQTSLKLAQMFQVETCTVS